MRRALSFLLLAALPAVGETIVFEPCREEPPNSEYDTPLCADYNLNTTLIDSAEAGDASALALLEKRYAVADTYSERHRIAAALLRRLADDSAIWKDIYADAQLAVRFADAEDDAFEKWCEEHDFYSAHHMYVLHDALDIAASDPRSHPLLVKALGSGRSSVAMTAVCGLAVQRDLDALPAIEKVLERFPDDAPYVARVLSEFHSARADAIASKYLVAEDDDEEEDEEDQEQR